jgi:HSP20 family protein
MGKVKDEIDRVFERFFPVRLLDEPMPFPLERQASDFGWMPAFDLVENEKEYVVRLEVPGIHKENLDINLTGNLLTIMGNRDASQVAEGENYLWREREIGKFRRVARLPADVMADKVEATCQDGLLTIVLPKQAPVVASKVTIK